MMYIIILFFITSKRKEREEARGELVSFVIYAVKTMMSLTEPSCISLSGPSWSSVSPGTISPTSLRQMKPALLLFVSSITEQEKGAERNPLVPLQNWFLFAVQMPGCPDAHKWLQLPEAPSEDGIEHPPTGFICVPHKMQETCC